MKYIVFIIFTILIITQKGATLPICNMDTAKQAIPPVIFAQTTIDGLSQPPFVTRFLHNKPGIFAHEVTRCYFAAVDPVFIYKSVSIVGIFFWIYFAYYLFAKKIYPAIIIFMLIPILPFFNVPPLVVSYLYKIFAIIGLTLFLKR